MTVIGSRRNKNGNELDHLSLVLRVEPTRTHLGDQLGHRVGQKSVDLHLRVLRILHLGMVGNLHLRAIGNGQ
eukprot:3600864-Amphidinium_carterae.1